MNRKGVVEIELAIVLFLIIIIFISIFQIFLQRKDELNKNYEINYLNNNARDLCYLLTKSEGIPNNWNENINNLTMLGLYNNSNKELSLSKINYLGRADVNNTLFVEILDKLNYSFNFFIQIKSLDNSKNYLIFGRQFYNAYNGDYICYAILNNTQVKVEVKTWS